MDIGYKILRFLLAPIVRLIFGIKVVGKENIPKNGPYIVCANHTSVGDMIVIDAALKPKVHYMAKKEAFKPGVAWILKGLGAFPVDRSGANVSAIKTTIDILDKKKVVGMFPQGTRHKGENPRDTQVKSGVGMVAWHSKCGVLPVYLKTKNNHVKPFARTTVIVGKIITNDAFEFENGGTSEYKVAADKVFDEICTLGENYGGK